MAKTKKNVQKKRRQLRKKTRGRKIKGGKPEDPEDPPSGPPGAPPAYLKTRAWAIKQGFGQQFTVIYYRRGFRSWDLFRTCSTKIDVPRKTPDLAYDLYYLLWECNDGIAKKYSIDDYEIDADNRTIHVFLNSTVPYQKTTDELMEGI